MARFRLRNLYEGFLDFLEIIITGVVIFLLIYLFIGQLLVVSGGSMEPTLHGHEQIIAEKISLAFKPLEKGEIVIFRHPEDKNKLLIKRVVGLPEETVLFSDGNVFINDQLIEEPYLAEDTLSYGGKTVQEGIEYEIPQNYYLLLGDNRAESSDSRSLGAISEDLIMGRALLVYSPLKNFRLIEH